MAKIVGVYNASHSPFCFMPPEQWDEMRSTRKVREDVPLDGLDENRRKASRLQDALATLRQKIANAQPDVAVIFASDQLECFDFTNFPSFAVYVGEDFEGRALSSGVPEAARAEASESGPRLRLRGHPELAVGLLTGLMEHGFDPAFCMDMPKPERGVAHGLIWKAQSMTGVTTPIVPVLLNCHYAPQVTAARCYELGKAVRKIIEAHPSSLRVAVVGTGGLWHTPGARDAYLDEEFDRAELSYLEKGDIKGMATHFDSYSVPADDASQSSDDLGRSSTGMPLSAGPQGGTRQTCNWIAAAAVADGGRATILDYVPVYASPIGAAFAYCEEL
jgi:hypothetical protein